jgi:EAL domain-containing protein (putative c-di-GMP-specific phosphodiesterase class I)/PAS domain-containing protein
MRMARIFRGVTPYLTVAGVIILVVMLLAAIYFTLFDLQWVAFLAGILVAAILAMVSRASRAEWTIARRNAQLQLAREKLAAELRRRQGTEEVLAGLKSSLQFADTDFPLMVVFLDTEERCRYHNHAIRRWIGRKADQIDGWRWSEVVGDKAYAALKSDIGYALGGQQVRVERELTLPDAGMRRLSLECFPQFGRDEKVAGIYLVSADITGREAAPAPAATEEAAAGSAQQMYVDTFSEQATGWNDAAERIVAAIENDEFRLFCQRIMPLDSAAGLADCYEILIRLSEEEDSFMPPGAFLPLAEKYGLMPRLDRWVVQHVLKWASSNGRHGPLGRMLWVNVAGPTLDDPDFAEYVGEQRRRYDISGGIICFEISGQDAIARPEASARFVAQIRELGCHAALCDFGRGYVGFDALKKLGADFLKIDGNVILGMLRNPTHLAIVTAINKVAHANGVRTIAEYVEDDETIAKLRELGINYAQGFGISRPCPLEEIETA